MRNSKLNQISFTLVIVVCLLITFSSIQGQDEDGYYLHWNTDHTLRTIRPSIRITEEEAKVLNCYKVKFNADGSLKTVQYFVSGKKSDQSNYGAHLLERKYYPKYTEEIYRDIRSERVSNDKNVWTRKYSLNDKGFWILKENFDSNGELINEYNVAFNRVERDQFNRRHSEIKFSTNSDTIPDPNGFKVTHFTYDQAGHITSRKNFDHKGELINGPYGYATVIFYMDENGQFYGEEFRDHEGKLSNSTSFGYAKVDTRDFNQYGKNKRLYFTDESGYPSEHKATGIITYNENMSRDEIIYLNKIGKTSSSPDIRVRSKFIYDQNMNFIRRENYNYKGELMK